MDWNLEQKLLKFSRFTSILSRNYSKIQAQAGVTKKVKILKQQIVVKTVMICKKQTWMEQILQGQT